MLIRFFLIQIDGVPEIIPIIKIERNKYQKLYKFRFCSGFFVSFPDPSFLPDLF